MDNDVRAYDYLVKPIDIDVLRDKVERDAAVVERASAVASGISTRPSTSESSELRRPPRNPPHSKLARSKSTILIFGETGTLPRLHELAAGRQPFKVLNCAAVMRTFWRAVSDT